MDFDTGSRPARRPATHPPLCIHHWVIDTADGAESNGRCKHCGKERCFSNSLESDSWTGLREGTRLGSVVSVPAQRTVELADEL